MRPVKMLLLKRSSSSKFLGVTFNTSYFGIPVALPSYAYTIFPIIVAVAIAKPLNAWLKKVLPLALRPIFQPMITFFITASIVLLLVGPVISTISSGLSFVIDHILSKLRDCKYYCRWFVSMFGYLWFALVGCTTYFTRVGSNRSKLT